MFNNGDVVNTVPLTLAAGQGTVVLPAGFRRPVDGVTTARLEFVAPDGSTRRSPLRVVPAGQMTLRVDSNNDSLVDYHGMAADRLDAAAEAAGTPFTFWSVGVPLNKPTPLDLEKDASDWATIQIRFSLPVEEESEGAGDHK